MRRAFVPLLLFVLMAAASPARAGEKDESERAKLLNVPPDGFTALFNGKDLTGWKGLVANPEERAKMSKEELAAQQAKADEDMRAHWKAEDGIIVFDGKGQNLCTAEDFGNFELYVDWKIEEKGDSGIYLRGTPQVQIWDPGLGGQNAVGSGGLFNNEKHPNKPLAVADKPVGEWNTFYIKMVGEKVTIKLNDKLVVDETVLENYWNRAKPIYETGAIELQNHGNTLYFRNIFVRKLDAEGKPLAMRGSKNAKPQASREANAAGDTFFVALVEDEEDSAVSDKIKARVEPKQPRKALIYTHAAGFVHSSIPIGAKILREIGAKTGAFEGVISDNPASFDEDTLKQFDAIVLVNTTGDWLLPAGDALGKLPQEEQAKLLKQADARRKNIEAFVAGGKGLVGFHAASDSQYQWAAFGKMIGGYFNQHPWHELVSVKVEEPKHALSQAFAGERFEITDEIYQFKDPYSRKDLRVLLSLDNDKLDTSKGIREDKDYAVAWIHNVDKGRVFYSSLGHREEVYANPVMQQFYLDGIQFALGDLEADATPSAKE